MAEFCNKCAEKYGMKADIDIHRLSFFLRHGEVKQTDICEGCGLVAIRKGKYSIIEFKTTGSSSWHPYNF